MICLLILDTVMSGTSEYLYSLNVFKTWTTRTSFIFNQNMGFGDRNTWGLKYCDSCIVRFFCTAVVMPRGTACPEIPREHLMKLSSMLYMAQNPTRRHMPHIFTFHSVLFAKICTTTLFVRAGNQRQLGWPSLVKGHVCTVGS